MKDLWGGKDGKASQKNKQPDRSWVLSSKSAIKRDEWEARVRPSNPSAKNEKAAVPLPHGGQSYHPSDDAHQHALLLATKNLEKKKKQDEKWIKSRNLNEEELLGLPKKKVSHKKPLDNEDAAESNDDSSSDDEQEEEYIDNTIDKEKMTRSQVLNQKKQKTRDQKLKHGKKLSKSELAERKKFALNLKRKPNQLRKNKDIDRIEEIADEVGAALYRTHQLSKYRKNLRKKNQTTISFGRHHHQPLAMEVAPTQALTGNLRQLMSRKGANAVVHPVVDRMKSLEARNMVPAKMRHKYNKRKEVIANGEVKVIRETFGTRPTSD